MNFHRTKAPTGTPFTVYAQNYTFSNFLAQAAWAGPRGGPLFGLPLWMGLAGLFKPVQASLFKCPGQGLGVAQARVQAG